MTFACVTTLTAIAIDEIVEQTISQVVRKLLELWLPKLLPNVDALLLLALALGLVTLMTRASKHKSDA